MPRRRFYLASVRTFRHSSVKTLCASVWPCFRFFFGSLARPGARLVFWMLIHGALNCGEFLTRFLISIVIADFQFRNYSCSVIMKYHNVQPTVTTKINHIANNQLQAAKFQFPVPIFSQRTFIRFVGCSGTFNYF